MCNQCKLLAEALGKVLQVDGVLNGIPGTGSELLVAADDYIESMKKELDNMPIGTIIDSDGEEEEI